MCIRDRLKLLQFTATGELLRTLAICGALGSVTKEPEDSVTEAFPLAAVAV